MRQLGALLSESLLQEGQLEEKAFNTNFLHENFTNNRQSLALLI